MSLAEMGFARCVAFASQPLLPFEVVKVAVAGKQVALSNSSRPRDRVVEYRGGRVV